MKYPEELHLKNYSLNYDKKSTDYQLIGIIKHEGDERSGHKIALCRDQSEIWHIYNDSKHHELRNPPLEEDLVFLLIYQRINRKNKNNVGINNSETNNFKQIFNRKFNIKEIESNYQKKKNKNKILLNQFYQKIYEKSGCKTKEQILVLFDNNGKQNIDQEGYLDINIFVDYLIQHKISIPQLIENYIKNNKVHLLKLFDKYNKFIEKTDSCIIY